MFPPLCVSVPLTDTLAPRVNVPELNVRLLKAVTPEGKVNVPVKTRVLVGTSRVYVEETPDANDAHVKVAPLAIVRVPGPFVPFPPTVIAPLTVKPEVPEKVNVPALEFFIPIWIVLQTAPVEFTVTVYPPPITTSSVAIGVLERSQVALAPQLPFAIAVIVAPCAHIAKKIPIPNNKIFLKGILFFIPSVLFGAHLINRRL